jgi:hypothetical protein
MKQNCRAPAPRKAGTCGAAAEVLVSAPKGRGLCHRSAAHVCSSGSPAGPCGSAVSLGPCSRRCAAEALHRPAPHRTAPHCAGHSRATAGHPAAGLTRLKATATGEPVAAACSRAYSSAQLSATRWSRDILQQCTCRCMSCECHVGPGSARVRERLLRMLHACTPAYTARLQHGVAWLPKGTGCADAMNRNPSSWCHTDARRQGLLGGACQATSASRRSPVHNRTLVNGAAFQHIDSLFIDEPIAGCLLSCGPLNVLCLALRCHRCHC